MKKRILSLCMVLMLCLGLLPTTVLAAAEGAPNNLYVGNQNVKSGEATTFWTTDKSTGGLTECEGNDDNWNVKYDPSTVTLTLKNATIEGEYDDVNISGAGIYAASSSGPVSLNIVLEEENKVSGMYGIDVSSSGGSASLNISGSGSLTVSGHSGNGIGIFMSSQNSANLTIEEASVTALGSQVGGSGVRLITSQTGSPSLTIEVKGGSLQASGETNGIHFLSNANDATAVANLNVSGNAMVKASNIITTKDGTGSAPELKPAASGSDGTGGIIWDGKSGTVYGSVTLQEGLEIGEGESLTLDNEASLDANGYNVIVDGGIVDDNIKNSLGDSMKYTPTITTTSLPNGTVGTGYSTTLSADGTASITWSVDSDSLPAGLSLDASTGVISGTPTAEGVSTFTVTAANAYGSDSREFTLNIDKSEVVPVTGVKLDKTSLTLQETDSATLTATVDPADATNKNVNWESNDTSIATVDASGKVTAISAGNATITAIAADGSGESASCSVTVTHGNMVHTPKKDATCTADGNEEYWYCSDCEKYFKDEKGEHEITLDETVIAKLPKLLNGANAEWSKGKKEGLTFSVDANISDFIGVKVDQQELDPSMYEVRSGSTIITLKPSYLESLSSGKHEIRMEFKSGTIQTYFTIKKGSDSQTPETGQQTNLYMWIGLLAASALVLGFIGWKRHSK